MWIRVISSSSSICAAWIPWCHSICAIAEMKCLGDSSTSRRIILPHFGSFWDSFQGEGHSLHAKNINIGLKKAVIVVCFRYFEKEITADDVAQNKSLKSVKPAFDWGATSLDKFAECLLEVCKALKPIVLKEPRLLRLKAPVYVLGKSNLPLFLFRKDLTFLSIDFNHFFKLQYSLEMSFTLHF